MRSDERKKILYGSGGHFCIRIKKQYIFSNTFFYPLIIRFPKSLICLIPHKNYLRKILLYHFNASVGRRIINDNDFKRKIGFFKRCIDTCKTPEKKFLGIMTDNDY